MSSRDEIRLETCKKFRDKKNGRAFVAFLTYNQMKRRIKFIWEEPCLKVLGRKGKYWAWWLFYAQPGDMIAYRLHYNQKYVTYCIVKRRLLSRNLYLKKTTRTYALKKLAKNSRNGRSGKFRDRNLDDSRYIPGFVRSNVWDRDGGCCVKCKSSKNIEFDHIIPYSKGGSNTERNIQLLCRSCNRQKYNKIAY